ncbi:MAG: hypothetical protein GX111_00840 [Clostridiales bacterium]|nr:hypothetical protein [Clostridiales bacterium]
MLLSSESAFLDIIADECRAFFFGDKSAEETAKIIKNKLEVYFSEKGL